MPHIFVRAGSLFTPSGMTKNASTQAFTGITATQVTDMAAESGSTLSGSALLPNGSKVGATVVARVSLASIAYGSNFTVSVRKNNVLVPGATITVGPIYDATTVITVPSTSVDVTASDLFTLWISAGNTTQGATVTAGSGTYVRLA